MILESAYLDDLKIWDCYDPPYPIGLTAQNLGAGPEPRASSAGKPSADGTINRTRYWGPRLVELQGYVQTASEYDRNHWLGLLRGAFTLRQPHVLRFKPLGQDEQVLGVVVNSRFDAPVEGNPPVLRWAITLEAPDPRMYLAALLSHSYEPGTGSGVTHGLNFLLVFPLDFSAASTPGGEDFLSADNPGSAPTPVLLTVEGPATSLSGILNRTTGERVAFNLVGLDAGEVLTVDTNARTVELGGVAAPELIDAAGNTWFELQPGENVLILEGAGFVPGVTSLTATYRAAVL